MNAIVKAEHGAGSLVVRDPPMTGAALYRMSSDAAGLCRDIVVATAQNIQGRKYVRVEGWQALALAHGCVASSGSVERVETGYRATGRVISMSTGIEIASAEGFVGDDEKMWATRPEYARRAMAQTRSISRACRSAFAHVVVMMNAGLSTTPAEEIEDDEPHRPANLQSAAADRRASAQAAATEPPPKKMTVAEFLDGLDRELELAPDLDALQALMTSTRVTEARSFMKNGAAERLADWTKRADAKRQAMLNPEPSGEPSPEQIAQQQPGVSLDDTMPDDIGDWPLAGEEMLNG